ncbi:MAG: plasmid recombination protein, partial [Phocaeicola plebeius]|nr:plasmid recombination protein [Phocaeicola plebeius]
MGYAVLHMEKTSGTDAAMSAHIERTIHPKNAEESKTHLNRELIKFPDGVENRTQAIQYRLDTAGLTRKIGNNQVRAIRILLTGTHEDMKRITNDGRLDEWCTDNLIYLADTFGRENIVSAVLHMDEQTPHIHATLVPIVKGERKRKKKEEQV